MSELDNAQEAYDKQTDPYYEGIEDNLDLEQFDTQQEPDWDMMGENHD